MLVFQFHLWFVIFFEAKCQTKVGKDLGNMITEIEGTAEILANFVSIWGCEMTFLGALLDLYTFT